MRGLYTAGVLDVMLDMGLEPDVICGTSAGVTFGVNLKSKQRGRVLRYNIRFAGDKRYISLRSWLTTGDMVNVPFAYNLLPRELDPFDNETYMRTPCRFFATVTNMRTGKAEYMRVDDSWAQMQVIRASASLPFLSRKVRIGGEEYLDGGIVDNIPIDKCLQEGCDRVIVVLTRPKGHVSDDHLSLLSRIVYPRYPELQKAFDVRNEVYRRKVERINRMEEEGKLFVIRPSRYIEIARLERNPDKLQALYNLAIEDTDRLRDGLLAYLGLQKEV